MRNSKTLPGNRGLRIQALFEAARGLSPAQQASFLDQACAGDIEIRREIDAILAAARGPTDQRLKKLMDMDRTVVDQHTVPARRGHQEPSGALAATLLPEAGTRIGQYELVRELGRGGMAVVYLARDIKLGRRVAIKFLQTNEGSLAQRFVLEAQATARCLYGENEDDSLCPEIPPGHVHAQSLAGGHHFDGAYDKLAELIVQRIAEP